MGSGEGLPWLYSFSVQDWWDVPPWDIDCNSWVVKGGAVCFGADGASQVQQIQLCWFYYATGMSIINAPPAKHCPFRLLNDLINHVNHQMKFGGISLAFIFATNCQFHSSLLLFPDCPWTAWLPSAEEQSLSVRIVMFTFLKLDLYLFFKIRILFCLF